MRKLTTTSILNDDELAILAKGIHQVLGESVTLAVKACGLDVEAILRFMPVAERCRIARTRKGLSLKNAARALRVPQYRLKDIEGNRVGAVDQAVLVLYIDCHSAEDVTRVVHEEFVRWFEPETAGPRDRYQLPSEEIWKRWQEAGLNRRK